MRTMSAKEAKNHFGELLMEAQRAPVAIEKNGKPVGVLYSWEDHEIIEKIKFERLKAMIQVGLAELDRGEGVPMTDKDFEELKAEARAEFERRRGA
jgi:prevent-host-death family protein